MPAPTKSLWFVNANSILGTVKWHYNTVVNVPPIEMIGWLMSGVVDIVRVGRYCFRSRFLAELKTAGYDGFGHKSVPAGFSAHALKRHLQPPSEISRFRPW